MKPARLGAFAEFGEALRRDELDDRKMFLRRLQILAHREDVDADRPRVVESRFDLVVAFAEPEHQRGFREAFGRTRFRVRKHAQRLIVTRSFVANGRREAANGFEVVREDVGSCVHDDVERAHVTTIIAAQNFDFRARYALVNCAHGIREDQRSAVGEVVTVDGGEHEILPSKIAHGACDAYRFQPVDDAFGIAGLDVAEATAARAEVSEDHDRRRSRAPTLRNVWTRGFLTDGMEPEAGDFGFDPLVVVADRQRDAQPVGLSHVTRGGVGVDQVDVDGHGDSVGTKAMSKAFPSSSTRTGLTSARATARPVSLAIEVTPWSARPQGLMRRS